MSWFSQLKQASFRGIPFAVLGSEGHFGRRVALHEYPYRDTPWVEDLGRSTRQITLTGFLVSDSAVYGGGDVLAQRERIIGACEAPGEGILVHPTLGRLTVSCANRYGSEGALVVNERWDHGRYFELTLSFIESGKRIFPSVLTSTADAVNAAAAVADTAANADFVTRASVVLVQGSAVVGQAVSAAAIWARNAQGLSNDATSLHNMVGTLEGSYGRYFAGRNQSGFSSVTNAVTGGAATVNSLISLGAESRANVGTAGSTLSTIASGLGL
ncbi:MAG: DNA circularization N-terminal domain-containing protein [Pseudomonadota bacterium]|nr:DNA circularization N-terminal domain-containing protein [Pseudomonadota bacterium]